MPITHVAYISKWDGMTYHVYACTYGAALDAVNKEKNLRTYSVRLIKS